MQIYLVGGAVRDALLHLPVRERDWVVVGATVQEMIALGYHQVEGGFPVFRHPQSGEEYALARRDRKTGLGHQGFTFDTGPDVTLELDLERRDLSINAMAQAPDGTIIDPLQGRRDLDAGLLRHVSPAFVEDPLRLLRVARFAATLGRWGFRVAHSTHRLMKEMAQSGELSTLSPARVWEETEKALAQYTPSRYFDVLRRCGALQPLFPEIAGVLGAVSGHDGPHAAEADQALRRLDAAARKTQDLGVRLAVFLAFLHNASTGDQQPSSLATRLPLPRDYSELIVLAAERCSDLFRVQAAPDVLAFLEAVDALRRRERFERLMRVCELAVADDGAYARTTRMRQALHAAVQVRPQPLLAAGLRGQALGAELRKQRLRAIQALEGG